MNETIIHLGQKVCETCNGLHIGDMVFIIVITFAIYGLLQSLQSLFEHK